MIPIPRFLILLFFFLSLSSTYVAATNHVVGQVSGWDLDSDVAEWAASTTFRVGDTLVFKYSPEYDVQEVGQLAFTTCDTTKPIKEYNDGFTTIMLTEPGTRYFICGQLGHCDSGMKMEVDVLSLPPQANRYKNNP
ncbi:hypothetical protein Patl1_19337 [Pistacia atlantica]|uniref:Uncharacterized protein n=1 Tax=Pistacia atlantica TaxID=434234 RepID=A0ACC1C2G1_9ROSI|nr:hypothetical protein Patl1_19337 [Pistacia atlantica]